MAKVVIEQAQRDGAKSLVDGGDLREDIEAVALLMDHLLDPADLAFEAAEPVAVFRLVLLGDVAMGCRNVPIARASIGVRLYNLGTHSHQVRSGQWIGGPVG